MSILKQLTALIDGSRLVKTITVSTSAPQVTDDASIQFEAGISTWIRTGTNKQYYLVDDSAGAAVWVSATGDFLADGTVPLTADLAAGAHSVTGLRAPVAAGEAARFEDVIRHVIADPGTGQAIPVTTSGNIAITTAGAETNTLANPSFVNQVLSITLDVDGGDRVITAATAINQAGNTHITLNDAGDCIVLIGVKKAGGFVWRVLVNDGCTLS